MRYTGKGKKSKKDKEASDKAPQKRQQKKPGDIKGVSYFFYRAKRHTKKHCTNYHAWRDKKDILLNLVYAEVNLTSIPRHIWWIDSSVMTHLNVFIQGYLNCRGPRDSKKYMYVKNDKMVKVKAIENFRLLLKSRFYTDLDKAFIVPCFRWNLISTFALDKFDFSYSFGNRKSNLFYDSKLVGSSSLSSYDNLYLIDAIASFNEFLQLKYTRFKEN